MAMPLADCIDLCPEYTEPNYPITKTELFDEDNLKLILTDERFCADDRKRLSNYNKHRQSGGQILVQYRLAVGCEEHNIGRLYPNDGVGLASYRFDMRNPLTAKNYWDIDIENAHYRIAVKQCRSYGLECPTIIRYVENREECLALVSSNRKKAKTEFLKILYGGDIKLYDEWFDEVEGDISVDGLGLLVLIKNEVNILMNKLWEVNIHLHKIKTGKKKIPIHKQSNCKATLMSLIFQTEERRLLMFIDYFIKKRYNRTLGLLIHDGGNTQKLAGETQFPTDILDDCSITTSAKFQLRIKITQKPIIYDWSPPINRLGEYPRRKIEFEKRNFFVGSQFIHIQDDGLIEFVKIHDMKVRLQYNNYMEYNLITEKMEKKFLFTEWLEDPERAMYDRIDFIPDVKLCPEKVFNLFKGFNADKFKPEKPLTEKEILELVEPIIIQMNYITTDNADWLMSWFGRKIQTPTKKNEVAILIRDMGGLFDEGGGTGKNLLFEWIGNEIIGEEYFYVVGDNKELYGSFNSQFEAKLVVMVEEASSKENHANNDILKSKITAKRQNVNKKGIINYSVKDFCDYLFASNNRNPLPVKQGDRRMAIFDTNPCMRGNAEYFITFAEHLDKPIVKWAFYQYLKSVKICKTPIEMQNSIPITTPYIEIRMMNAPLYLKWISYEVRRGKLRNANIRSLHQTYKNWVKISKEGAENSVITERAFALLLQKDSSVYLKYELDELGDKQKSHGLIKFRWNIDGVIAGLKRLHLLEEDFVYVEDDTKSFDDIGENE